MPLNAQFFAAVRSSVFAGSLAQSQVDALNVLASEFDAFTGHDHCTDDLAYIMATCLRECGEGLDLGIEEIGKGRGKAYGVPAGPYNKVYYGRGPCQTTWLANYARAEKRTNIPLTQYPEKLCEPALAVRCMIDGMYAGLFTGVGLRNFITPGVFTPLVKFVSARKIINGTDHAAEVANNAAKFQAALLVGYDKPTLNVSAQASNPTQSQGQSPQRQGLVADIRRLFGRM